MSSSSYTLHGRDQQTFSQGFKKSLSVFISRFTHHISLLESLKSELLSNHQFNPFIAFQHLDSLGQGYLTPEDLTHYLISNYSF
jgi:hypothetical protein